MTTSTPGVEAVLAVFAAVEQRDDQALARACQPDVEFCWPPSLPYGSSARDWPGAAKAGPPTGTGCSPPPSSGGSIPG